jgi:hypothetical protein
VRAAGTHGAQLWWACGNYCSEHLTDGRVPKDEIRDVWRPKGERFQLKRAIKRAIEAGLLKDMGDHYLVHDYLQYNPSKSQVLAARASAKSRQASRRDKRRDTPRDLIDPDPGPTRTQVNSSAIADSRGTATEPNPDQPALPGIEPGAPNVKPDSPASAGAQSTQTPKRQKGTSDARKRLRKAAKAVHGAFCEIFGKDPEKYKPTNARITRIESRLNDGYSAEELIEAAHNAYASHWVHESRNCTIDHVYRNGDMVERYSQPVRGPGRNHKATSPPGYFDNLPPIETEIPDS